MKNIRDIVLLVFCVGLIVYLNYLVLGRVLQELLP